MLRACLLVPFLAALLGAAPEPPLLPRPAEAETGGGVFRLRSGVTLVARGGAQASAERLAGHLKAAGIASRMAERAGGPAIRLELDPRCPSGEEGYELRIAPGGLRMRAAGPAGLFYAVQTLRQLLPDRPGTAVDLPAMTVRDRPRFPWRGMHLDVSRHFVPVAELKRYLDLMAQHKLNVFHWHLVDDGGWRLEVKAYPRLTELGAWRQGDGRGWDYKANRFGTGPGGRVYGGFYTQAQAREIVAYAAERHITVVPEIEMPGHTMPSLAAYPDLACGGAGAWAARNGLFHPNVYCAGREDTFRFLEKVLDEVLALFPSRFIHIGGDEVDKTLWAGCPECRAYMAAHGLKSGEELQGDFIRRIDRYLAARGRRLVGWDEILEGGLAPGATVMSWRGTEGGIAAARAGHDVVMTPGSHCYFDTPHRFLPELRVWSFDPVPPGLPEAEARHVLGAQGCVWTEWMDDYGRMEFMAGTRMAALAEAVWTPVARRDEASFRARLARHLRRLDAQGVRLHLEPPAPGLDLAVGRSTVEIALPAAPLPGLALRYTLDGRPPGPDSPIAAGPPLRVGAPATLSLAWVWADGRATDPAVVRVLEGRAEAGPDLEPGLVARFAAGEWAKAPDLRGETSARVTRVAEPGLDPGEKAPTFGMNFEGYLRIPREGIYTLVLESDDGSTLHLGGELAIDNDGLHPPAVQRVRAWLAKGDHPLLVRYCQGGGGAVLRLSIEGERPEGGWFWRPRAR